MSSNQKPNEEEEMTGTEQPFLSHLIELRDRLIRALISVALVAGVLAIWPGPNALYDKLAKPLTAHLTGQMIAVDVMSPFFVPLKVLLLTALLIALPFVLYQAWAFIAPGLYKKEKILVLPLVISSTLLFFAGVGFSYFFVFDKVFTFIMHFAPESIHVAPDIAKYLGFAMNMFLAFGIAFEVPIVVVVLVRLGVVSVEKLKSIRGYVIVGTFIIAAVITPPDVISQLALAIPMCLLYEVGLFVARFIAPKNVDDDEKNSSVAAESR